MIKRSAAFLLLIATAIILISGCSGQTSQQENITFTDASNTPITLTHTPKRVAVLLSSFADIWVTAGGTVDITVCESVSRGFAGKDAILVDEGAGKSIDIERLIDAKPDLVIGSADIAAQTDAVVLCRKAGIPAGVFRVECFEDYLKVLKTFTNITGNPDRYLQDGVNVQLDIEKAINIYRASEVKNKILFIRSGASSSSMKAKTAQDHFACQMLKELGTVNIADEAPILLDGLSFEEILLQDPDYIFVSTMGDETAAKEFVASVLSQPQWQSLNAVKNAKVYYLPKELFQFKPNKRWSEAYQYLIDILEK